MLKFSLLFGLSLMTIATLAEAADEPLVVPQGSPVTVDGSFGDPEWADAASRTLDDGVELLAKQEDDFVDLGLRFPAEQ